MWVSAVVLGAVQALLFALFFQYVLFKSMELEDTTTISKVHKHVRHFPQDPSAACIDGDAAHAASHGGFPKEECVLWSDIHSWRAMSTCGAGARARPRDAAPLASFPEALPRSARALPAARHALGSRAPPIDPLAPGGWARHPQPHLG